MALNAVAVSLTVRRANVRHRWSRPTKCELWNPPIRFAALGRHASWHPDDAHMLSDQRGIWRAYSRLTSKRGRRRPLKVVPLRVRFRASACGRLFASGRRRVLTHCGLSGRPLLGRHPQAGGRPTQFWCWGAATMTGDTAEAPLVFTLRSDTAVRGMSPP